MDQKLRLDKTKVGTGPRYHGGIVQGDTITLDELGRTEKQDEQLKDA